MEFVEAGKN